MTPLDEMVKKWSSSTSACGTTCTQTTIQADGVYEPQKVSRIVWTGPHLEVVGIAGEIVDWKAV